MGDDEREPPYELSEEDRRKIRAWAATARRLPKPVYDAVMGEMEAAYERQQAEREAEPSDEEERE